MIDTNRHYGHIITYVLYYRCGLIHARGLPPTTKVSQQEIQDYCKQFESKISTLVIPNQVLTPEELVKLGAKDSDKYPFKVVHNNLKLLTFVFRLLSVYSVTRFSFKTEIYCSFF